MRPRDSSRLAARKSLVSSFIALSRSSLPSRLVPVETEGEGVGIVSTHNPFREFSPLSFWRE